MVQLLQKKGTCEIMSTAVHQFLAESQERCELLQSAKNFTEEKHNGGEVQ